MIWFEISNVFRIENVCFYVFVRVQAVPDPAGASEGPGPPQGPTGAQGGLTTTQGGSQEPGPQEPREGHKGPGKATKG